MTEKFTASIDKMEFVPDFFIAGAPKSGTTSLYQYLRRHPKIFMPAWKEPKFFSQEFPERHQCKSFEEYSSLFQNAPPGTIRGEASPLYFYSRVAIPKIMALQPAAKFIVVLRNPSDMVHALHYHMLWCFNEHVQDFSMAWKRQFQVEAGTAVPYADYGRIGDQLVRFVQNVPESQRKVLIFDDLVQDPRRIYVETLGFLGIPDDGRQNFPIFNESKRRRSHILARLFVHPPFPLHLAKKLGDRVLQVFVDRPSDYIQWIHTQKTRRPKLDDAMRQELLCFFEKDVQIVEEVLGRKFPNWKPEQRSSRSSAAQAPYHRASGGDSISTTRPQEQLEV